MTRVPPRECDIPAQAAASGQDGMLKGANMISSSHKRIPKKMYTTINWEQPKPTDFAE